MPGRQTPAARTSPDDRPRRAPCPPAAAAGAHRPACVRHIPDRPSPPYRQAGIAHWSADSHKMPRQRMHGRRSGALSTSRRRVPPVRRHASIRFTRTPNAAEPPPANVRRAVRPADPAIPTGRQLRTRDPGGSRLQFTPHGRGQSPVPPQLVVIVHIFVAQRETQNPLPQQRHQRMQI